MADDEANASAEGANELELQDESSSGQANNKSTYRQKYKRAWELDMELRDWLSACQSDAYAAFCKYCRTKLHAHKKGLLAHAKSAKHKKHLLNPNFSDDPLAALPAFNVNDSHGEHDNGDLDDGDQRGAKRNAKGQRLFNDNWLRDPSFSAWLRKVPNNNTKALCIACRCVITAGRCELVKHTRAAKHKKAIMEGPFEEVGEVDLQWLETTNHDQMAANISAAARYNQIGNFRPSAIDSPGMMVDEVIKRLEKHVPLELAEKWDNVGTIIKPTQPVKVYNILLTIKLNERILDEAIKKRVQLIISYHPPWWHATKRLDPSIWKDKLMLLCMENRITIYSPHTALDAIKGGVNDWLVSPFLTSEENKIRPINQTAEKTNTSCSVVLLPETQETVAQEFKDMNYVTMTDYGNGAGDVRVTSESVKTLPEVEEHIAQQNYAQAQVPEVGMGRLVTFVTPLPLYEVVQRAKTHLDLNTVKLALSPKHSSNTKIESIAVCAGSGYSVLKSCTADVWITGEMTLHEAEATLESGTTIILGGHCNTERGFLRDWAQQLSSSVFEEQVYVSVSELDKYPFRYV